MQAASAKDAPKSRPLKQRDALKKRIGKRSRGKKIKKFKKKKKKIEEKKSETEEREGPN